MTSKQEEMPPLPEPDAWIVASSLQWLAAPERTPRAYTYVEMTRLDVDGDREPIFTADTVRSYAAQCVREAVERERSQKAPSKCGSECDYLCQQPDGFGWCGKRRQK